MSKKLTLLLLVSVCGQTVGNSFTDTMKRAEVPLSQVSQGALRKLLAQMTKDMKLRQGLATDVLNAAVAAGLDEARVQARKERPNFKIAPVSAALGGMVGEVAVQGGSKACDWVTEKTGLERPEGWFFDTVWDGTKLVTECTVRAAAQVATCMVIGKVMQWKNSRQVSGQGSGQS